MYSLAFLFTSLACFVLANPHRYYDCRPCRGEECDVQPEGCEYGITRDPCGRLTCMAGPGERCGGRDNHLGKCGSGMTCMCGVCRGCSIDKLEKGINDCNLSPLPICY